MYYTDHDLDILARTLYGEARGELQRYGMIPLIAIAYVVVNRYRKGFAKTIHDVCLAPMQFSCWNNNDPNCQKIKLVNEKNSVFCKCREIAASVLDEKWPDITNGCDHYHHYSIKPYWAAYLQPMRIYGSHCFYALRNSKTCA